MLISVGDGGFGGLLGLIALATLCRNPVARLACWGLAGLLGLCVTATALVGNAPAGSLIPLGFAAAFAVVAYEARRSAA